MAALRAECSFERFIPTEGTRLAYELATAFANRDKGAPRALLLWGPPGAGKTHLLEAIVRVAHAHDDSARVVHVTAAELVEDLIDRVRNHYAGARPTPLADMLAVDDLHVLRDRPATQREVAVVFKSVVDSGGRVACTTSCRPAEIDRLTSLLRELPQARVVQLGPADDAGMQRVISSLAVSEKLDFRPSDLAAMAGACHGDVRRAIGAIARRRFDREAMRP